MVLPFQRAEMSILIGVIVGFCLVGSSVIRTLSVSSRHIGVIVLSNLSNGFFYYISVNFVVRSDIQAYAGTVLGGLLACLLISWKPDWFKL